MITYRWVEGEDETDFGAVIDAVGTRPPRRRPRSVGIARGVGWSARSGNGSVGGTDDFDDVALVEFVVVADLAAVAGVDGRKIGNDHELGEGDVIKIVSTAN